MKGFFCGLFVFLVLIAIGFVSFWCWTEWKYDMSAIQYIKDKTQKEDVVEETNNDDIVVEDENGEVEATASINF